MKISELIERLGELQGKYGDIDCAVQGDGGSILPIEHLFLYHLRANWSDPPTPHIVISKIPF